MVLDCRRLDCRLVGRAGHARRFKPKALALQSPSLPTTRAQIHATLNIGASHSTARRARRPLLQKQAPLTRRGLFKFQSQFACLQIAFVTAEAMLTQNLLSASILLLELPQLARACAQELDSQTWAWAPESADHFHASAANRLLWLRPDAPVLHQVFRRRSCTRANRGGMQNIPEIHRRVFRDE